MTKKVREMQKANLLQMVTIALLTHWFDIQETKLRWELGEYTKKEALARIHAANEATDDSLNIIQQRLESLQKS